MFLEVVIIQWRPSELSSGLIRESGSGIIPTFTEL